MSNVAGCDAAGCCSEEVKEVVVFVSPTTAVAVVVVGGSFVGAIGGGGGSLTVFGFMLVVVCSISNERAANVVQCGERGVARSESIPPSVRSRNNAAREKMPLFLSILPFSSSRPPIPEGVGV